MRAFLRIVGLWMLGGALILLVIDGTRSLAANGLVFTGLGETIDQIAPDGLGTMREAIESNLHPLLWEPALTTLLAWPGWAVLGALAFGLIALGQRREPVGYARDDGM